MIAEREKLPPISITITITTAKYNAASVFQQLH